MKGGQIFILGHEIVKTSLNRRGWFLGFREESKVAIVAIFCIFAPFFVAILDSADF